MATRKRTITAVEAESSAKKSRAKEPASVGSTTSPSKTASKAKSAAATHKSAARRAPKSASLPTSFDAELCRDEIAVEAYYLWQNRGSAHGQEHEDWLRAIELVRARRLSA